MRKVLVFCALISFVFFLSGCNKKKDFNEITFSWWGGQERNVATLDVIEMFEEKYPEYKVRPQYTSWEGYYSQLSMQLIAGREPDIMQVNYNWFYLFGGDARFYDLSKLDIDLSIWPEGELDPITINGKVLGLSISETGRIFYLNKTVYEEAGIETIPKTWDELIEAGRIINGKDNTKYALGKIGHQGVAYMMFTYLSQKYEKNVIENNKLAFTKTELLDGFRFLESLRNNGVLIPTTKMDSNDGETNPKWIEGNYGGVFEWNTSIGIYRGTLPQKHEMITAGLFQINPDEQKGMYKKTSMAYAVSKKIKNKKAVETFLNFITTDEEAIKRLGLERGVPSNELAFEVLEKNDLLQGLEWDGHLIVQEYFDNNKECDLYIHPYYEDDTFRQVYEKEFELWLLGDKTADRAVDGLIKNFDTALADAMKS